jgi:hypothetical protein
MDQLRFVESQYRLEHRHEDGSWAEMVEERPHHDAAAHDEERAWGLRRIFRCRTCEEAATVIPGAEGGAVNEPG